MWAWSGRLCDIVALAMKSIIASSVALLFASAAWAASSIAVDESRSPLRPWIERYTLDHATLEHAYRVEGGKNRAEHFRAFLREWQERLRSLPFETLTGDGRIDYVLFENLIEHELGSLELQDQRRAEMAPLLPIAGEVAALEEAQEAMKPLDAAQTAAELDRWAKLVNSMRKTMEAGLTAAASSAHPAPPVSKTVAFRAAGAAGRMRDSLKQWFSFYNGYDPLFTWWVSEPYQALDQSLKDYAGFLREKVAGAADEHAIIGDPIGRAALLGELKYEMIPYTPEELIDIGNRELAWCEAEMKRASRELGYGDNWHQALEHVKTLHVEPGKQPELIRQLALEAVDFLDRHDLVTIPPLARESWRMRMMSPEAQLVNPFFLGGEDIIVAFPTNTMTEEAKRMSMRGNNIHFARATVFHELIPGHELQGFLADRYRSYRQAFVTPFFVEGWALYWEMLFWDLDFQKSPENRIGMLFWRMHRCARIIFSLSFHLGKMTPQQCIDFLVDRVGHERDNATAEVRRSFAGDYSPLYQCAYLLGGMQLMSLHRDFVDAGKMNNREFHDRILREGPIPVEMIRADLSGQMPRRNFQTAWRFYNPK